MPESRTEATALEQPQSSTTVGLPEQVQPGVVVRVSTIELTEVEEGTRLINRLPNRSSTYPIGSTRQTYAPLSVTIPTSAGSQSPTSNTAPGTCALGTQGSSTRWQKRKTKAVVSILAYSPLYNIAIGVIIPFTASLFPVWSLYLLMFRPTLAFLETINNWKLLKQVQAAGHTK